MLNSTFCHHVLQKMKLQESKDFSIVIVERKGSATDLGSCPIPNFKAIHSIVLTYPKSWAGRRKDASTSQVLLLLMNAEWLNSRIFFLQRQSGETAETCIFVWNSNTESYKNANVFQRLKASIFPKSYTLSEYWLKMKKKTELEEFYAAVIYRSGKKTEQKEYTSKKLAMDKANWLLLSPPTIFFSQLCCLQIT